jgi:hypothetical protein
LDSASVTITFQAFAIDIGCYAHLRKLDGRCKEIDVSLPDLKEQARSGPIFDLGEFNKRFDKAPAAVETALLTKEEA